MTTDDPVAPAPPTQRPASASLRPLLLRLHFYAGVLVGPFLLVAALTGLLYVFTPQLEDAIYDHELHVPAATAAQPLSTQVAAAQAALPGGTLVKIRPAPSATDTTQVLFSVPGLGESYSRTVFVNPHDNEIRGILDTYGSSQALPLRAWLDQLHRNLDLGDFGRLYSELAASWLWVVVLGGLVLWWTGRRRGTTTRARVRSRHATTGTVVAVVLLFLSATGLTWSQFAGENITDLRSALSWETPAVSGTAEHHDGGHVGAGAAAVTISPDAALAAARAVGLSDPVELTVPAKAGKAYVVKQTGRSWPSKQDSAAIDPSTGHVTEVLRFADYPLMAKLARWGIDAHMGLLFGLPNQILLAAVCLGLVTIICWGYRMWWLRRPTRGFGRPYPRGSLRKLPARMLPLAVCALAVGWFLPVFGVSLLAFLLLDLAQAARARLTTSAA
ncbi:MAG TPA: PepSY-associated TM helix domain-containing protein [Amycolatopsis sp.]|uniref:PepSY-associated TM helix domain-containing protein n=1 Tax=Amycolatopsis sp. TaxID=37632 RepID=UPI002B484F7B|nr:PepSY-associated TM helix domain-containing protein [Amycolatopsis sp.]HKS47580.1 PepSY-associated TM helix domain-containing protein [Amycolatopsis sp.]